MNWKPSRETWTTLYRRKSKTSPDPYRRARHRAGFFMPPKIWRAVARAPVSEIYRQRAVVRGPFMHSVIQSCLSPGQKTPRRVVRGLEHVIHRSRYKNRTARSVVRGSSIRPAVFSTEGSAKKRAGPVAIGSKNTGTAQDSTRFRRDPRVVGDGYESLCF